MSSSSTPSLSPESPTEVEFIDSNRRSIEIPLCSHDPTDVQVADLAVPLQITRTTNSSPAPTNLEAPRLLKRSFNSDDVTASRGRSGSLNRPFSTVEQFRANQSPDRRSDKLESRASSPGSGIVIASSTPLVGDARISNTRMILTKAHVSYPQDNPLIPFSAAVLGFNIVFHSPSSTSSRVHNADIKLTFTSSEGRGREFAPIVKALYPSHSTFGQTEVHFEKNNTLGLTFGYSPAGALTVGHVNSKKISTSTTANLITSGVETDCVFLTIDEDPSMKQGVPNRFDFAVLLFLPGGDTDRSFMAEITVNATVGGIRGLFAGGEKKYRLEYDGVTELGQLKIGGVVQVQRSPQIQPHLQLPIEYDRSLLGVTVEEI